MISTGEKTVSSSYFYAGAALAGVGTIACQVALSRLVAVVNWAPFAFFIISAGMLGMAASGTLLLLLPTLGRKFAVTGAAVGALLFSLTVPLGARVLMARPFNPLALAWHFDEAYILALNFIAIAVPFAGMGATVVLALSDKSHNKSITYGANLLGSAAGAPLIIAGMYFLKPHALLQVCAVVGVLGALAFAMALAKEYGRRRIAIFAGAAVCLALAFIPMQPRISQFKSLSQIMRIKGARIVAEINEPTGNVVAVENREIPHRHFPDLSLYYDKKLPAQTLLVTDGDSVVSVTTPAKTSALEVFNHMPSALGFMLGARERVLILGAGGGDTIALARINGASSILAVEPHRAIKKLALEISPALGSEDIRWMVSDIRSAIERIDDRFNLIQYGPAGSPAGALAGAGAIRENYTLTIEGVTRMIELLDDDGVLVISCWLKTPPRNFIKLIALVVEAARVAKLEDINRRLVVVRGMRTGVLALSMRPLSTAQAGVIRDFAYSRALDIVHLFDLDDSEANQTNRLEEPFYRRSTLELIAGKPLSYRWADSFDLRVVRDSRPFFDKTLNWRTLTGKLPGDKLGVVRQQEIGDFFIMAVLGQALVAFALLVLAPVALVKGLPWGRARTLFYFAAIGFAYMAVEVTFIQKLTVILGHEVYSISAVLALLIAFTGAGSLVYSRWKSFNRVHLSVTAGLIVVILLLAGVLLDARLIRMTARMPFVARVSAALCVLGPLGFLMGFFFPYGLSGLGAKTLPWAWAANGCASVAGAIMAAAIAAGWGFPVTVTAAAACYAAAAFCARGFD